MSAHIDPLIAACPAAARPVASRPTPARPARPAPRPDPAVRGVGEDGQDVFVVEDIEAVYRRMYPGLVRMAYLLVDTQELAEEAVQDAFAKAYSKWSRVQAPEAYMRTCVINACRRVQRRRKLVRRQPDPYVEHGELHADHIADVVRTLRTPMKEAVVLRYYLQLSDPEIAEALGIAVGTVKSTLHRARALLKKELS
ncbi:MAG: SigE family RNA polymerase sigma factor [Actinomycetota bacterium]|nr:SigE family RNA polymerase sigma factor [Actinomycetota bacterium]